MFRAFKTRSFVISNNLSRSQRSAVHIRQMCISAQSRLQVFKLLVSIWFNIQICWHTPAAENEGLPETQLFQSSCNCSCATKQKKHMGAAHQCSVISFSFYISETRLENILKYEFWKRKQTRIFCTVCSRVLRKHMFQERAILNFVQLRAELICSEQRRNSTRSNSSNYKSIISSPSWIWNLKVTPNTAICKSKFTMNIYDGISFIQGDVFH